MRIEFRRSGGLAGIDMTASIDAQDLPAEQAQLATELIASPPPPPGDGGGTPDRFSYELTLREGERTQTHRWGETQIPDSVRPLLADLTGRAKPAPPG